MKTIQTLAMIAVGLAASVVASQAAVDLNGTLGFAPFGVEVTYTGASLGAATSVTVSSLEVVNTTPLLYNLAPNHFNSGSSDGVTLFTPVALSTTTWTLSSLAPAAGFLTFVSSISLDTYVFDLTTLTTSSTGANNLILQGTGYLSDSMLNYNTTPALFSASFNTTGSGTVNGSFTLSTVPVPEPSTYIAGLGALCLFGFTAMPRRKQ